jgi:outer membrane receptor for monomeric catechols
MQTRRSKVRLWLAALALLMVIGAWLSWSNDPHWGISDGMTRLEVESTIGQPSVRNMTLSNPWPDKTKRAVDVWTNFAAGRGLVIGYGQDDKVNFISPINGEGYVQSWLNRAARWIFS